MLLKHYEDAKWQASPIPEQLDRDKEMYRQALAAVRQARQASTPAGYAFLDYYIGRLVFSVRYLNAVDSIRQAGLAAKSNRTAEAVQSLDQTLREVSAGLEAYAQVARDNSDRGTIAILNEYAYRSVKATRRKLAAQLPSDQ